MLPAGAEPFQKPNILGQDEPGLGVAADSAVAHPWAMAKPPVAAAVPIACAERDRSIKPQQKKTDHMGRPCSAEGPGSAVDSMTIKR